MNTDCRTDYRPKLGIQGPVLGWQDPWALEASDQIMRTGTGIVYPSQDPTPDRNDYLNVLKELGTDFYVHHVFPGLEGQDEMLHDLVKHGLEVCLGNEYGNINGPWEEGTNRYDVTDDAILHAARAGNLMGLLYDEPEHLQINAAQYRKDGWYPHWGKSDGLSLEQANAQVTAVISGRVDHVRSLLQDNGFAQPTPVVSEQVFPVMFHVNARAGMTVCPKVMKESFQSLQLSTALGAAKQYGRPMWICADLWGPDIGHWFTRSSGFPGHSPEEFASALELAYFMAPTHLFTENVDVLLRYGERQFALTEYGEVWQRFVKDFIPHHELTWNHLQADADIVVIHSDDSNYGQNARLFGNREAEAPQTTSSVFHIWHLLSHGTIPAHGSCMHIPGFDFPRHELKRNVLPAAYPLAIGCKELEQTRMHPLFYPVNNVLVFDEHVREEQLGNPQLILVGGTRISAQTLAAVRKKAEDGATVIIAQWLVPSDQRENRKFGKGCFLVTDNFLSGSVKEAALPFLGQSNCWTQRFGNAEVRIYKGDSTGVSLNFEVMNKGD